MPCIQLVLIDSSQYVRKMINYITVNVLRRWDNSLYYLCYNANRRDDSAEIKDLKSLKEEVPALLIEMSSIALQ